MKHFLFFILLSSFCSAKAQTPVPMSLQPGLSYTEDFSSISSWANGFTSGVGANCWSPVLVNTNGTIPDGMRTTLASTTFTTGTAGGVQKGSSSIQLLSTGTTSNTSAIAIDVLLDFSNVQAGTLSFNASTVFNSTGNRIGTLKVFWSIDGIVFTELTETNLPYIATNNVAGNAAISNLALPAAFHNNANVRLRFYYYNGTANGTTGNRPKIAIDDLVVTAVSTIAAPVVQSYSDSATVDQFYTYSIQANNNPTSFSASNLPAGVTINNSTGILSGIPTASTSLVTIPISASNAGGTGNASLLLKIGKGLQSIQINPIPNKTFGDPSFALQATGGNSGNPILFSSSDSNIASISGNMVSIHSAGICTITANQLGNSHYQNALPQSQTLTIQKASQTILFTPIPAKLITDLPFSLQAIGGNSGNPILYVSSNPTVASIAGNMVTIHQAGITTITASQFGNTNYENATDSSVVLIINKVPQNIIFSSIPILPLSSNTYTLSAFGGGSGNPVIFTSSNTSVATVNGNILQLHAVGTSIITAVQDGDSVYNQATPQSNVLVVHPSTQSATYTFGTVSGTETSNPTIGLPINNLLISSVSQGNNANALQTTLQISSSSVSTYAGASAQMNVSILARKGAFHPDSSAYFEFTLSPSSNYLLAIHEISFGTRSTSTGPIQMDIRSSLDNYISSVQNFTVNPNSNWDYLSSSFQPFVQAGTITFRIYGYGSVSTASIVSNNWRLDDIQIKVSLVPTTPCNVQLQASATSILCHGNTTTISSIASNTNGTVQYTLNNSVTQSASSFANVSAGNYTVTVADALGCTATSMVTISQPNALMVSAYDVIACNGISTSLIGNPSGGSFSIPNPYIGATTKYIYQIIDSNGCIGTSDSANVFVQPCATLQLTLFLQSYYIGAQTMVPLLYQQGVSNDLLLVDDIIVELRHSGTLSLLASATAYLQTNGTCTVNFPSTQGYYYIVIKHRNSITTWSATPVWFGSGTTTYNFSSASSNTFANNVIEVESGVWAIYSADCNQDENIDLMDYILIENDITSFSFGNVNTDLNGDGNVDLFDVPIYESNATNFVSSLYPTITPFPETMEIGSKSTYANASVSLGTGLWLFEDALLGDQTLDRKNGTQSARLQNTGKLSMQFNFPIDSAEITIQHAKYGTDAISTWALFISTDNGSNWTQQGATISTTLTSLQIATFNIWYTGDIRLQIRKLSGGRLNIDDIQISPYTGTSTDNNHTAFGNPSNAVTDLAFPNNYLLLKPQYHLAYNENKGTAAWVAWHLDNNDLGTTPRCDCFATDVQIPSSMYRASSSSYTGSGFDRGHMVPSSQRNNTTINNAATFLMSNIMPQSPNLNQITWNNLEQYCLNLVNAGYELYTYSGGYGIGGTGSNGTSTTIASGNITVPSHYWKIAVVLPNGTNDIGRLSTTTRIISVMMPNTQTVNTLAWGQYRTSIDAIEAATGFDFLSILPSSLQTSIETLIDNGPTN
jgi:endonuclease G